MHVLHNSEEGKTFAILLMSLISQVRFSIIIIICKCKGCTFPIVMETYSVSYALWLVSTADPSNIEFAEVLPWNDPPKLFESLRNEDKLQKVSIETWFTKEEVDILYPFVGGSQIMWSTAWKSKQNGVSVTQWIEDMEAKMKALYILLIHKKSVLGVSSLGFVLDSITENEKMDTGDENIIKGLDVLILMGILVKSPKDEIKFAVPGFEYVWKRRSVEQKLD
jgi:hypothetical protein